MSKDSQNVKVKIGLHFCFGDTLIWSHVKNTRYQSQNSKSKLAYTSAECHIPRHSQVVQFNQVWYRTKSVKRLSFWFWHWQCLILDNNNNNKNDNNNDNNDNNVNNNRSVTITITRKTFWGSVQQSGSVWFPASPKGLMGTSSGYQRLHFIYKILILYNLKSNCFDLIYTYSKAEPSTYFWWHDHATMVQWVKIRHDQHQVAGFLHRQKSGSDDS